jgi:light-regulated signal transduction histidine kinase (bacteriophytochrome)
LSAPPAFCPHSRTIEDGREHIEEVHEDRLGGDFLVTTTPLLDEKGDRIGSVHIAHDITMRKRAEEEIERLNNDLLARNENLELANKELEAFSYTVSHDLRAPLRHMSGFSGLLNKRLTDYPDEHAHHYIDAIGNSAKKMGMLIDDLLAFSRIGRANIQNKNVSLNDLIKASILEIKEELKGRDITWEIGELPDVYGDQSMLRLVLDNLIYNAVKYTRTRSHAKIQIGAKQERDEWIIFIQDNGVGFNVKYADKLFGVFQRLHPQDEFEGTGIGLATVRSIVARHMGRTWAEGSEGHGATFYFSLPKIKET